MKRYIGILSVEPRVIVAGRSHRDLRRFDTFEEARKDLVRRAEFHMKKSMQILSKAKKIKRVSRS